MRLAQVIITIVVLLTGCQKDSIISLNTTNQTKTIALQPLGQFNEQLLEDLSRQLSGFFNIRVTTLKPLDIPEAFSNREEKYAADSLLTLLSKIRNDTIVNVVGVTHSDIYVLRETKMKQVDGHKLYEQRGVFGSGYISGRTCVVSDYRLMTQDQTLLNKRLLKVIIHEIGHNIGLPHCPDESCLMSEANGTIAMLNKTGGDYCRKCRQRLD